MRFFEQAPDPDKLWAIALLSGKRPRRSVNTTLLRQWAAEQAQVPPWLFEESYHVVGDLAETMALLVPQAAPETAVKEAPQDELLTTWMGRLKGLATATEAERKAVIVEAWQQLQGMERFVFNKLITGGFRVGVSQKLMVRALARYTGKDEHALAHQLMGQWAPDTTTFEALVVAHEGQADLSRPYPFYLAYALEGPPEALGSLAHWQAERKWDGIRGQLICRQQQLFVWSRGEELVTDRFPEFGALATVLPNGTAIDGEVVPYADGVILPFQVLQTRIGRKNLTKAVLQKSPVVLIAYDLLEHAGQDVRALPQTERRRLLEAVVTQANHPVLQCSPLLEVNDWVALAAERAQSRAHHSEGLMLKRKDAPYGVGRKKGDWWKWKVDPMTIDAVLIYAMRGHGRRANLYTDFTFAVWQGEALVPFTKAYSGLTDKEIQEVDTWVKRNTLERFGPVRSVTPHHVFELAFEGINRSTRHKSGVALRFPRISRWRKDKPLAEANTLADLHALLALYNGEAT